MNKHKPIKTLLIDDHPVVLNGLKGLLSSVEGIEIINVANNGAEALVLLDKDKIELIISDITMPALNGIELAELVLKKYPTIKIILFTAYNEKEIIKRALQSGAHACLQKDITKRELLDAIDRVMDHGYYYSNNLLEMAIHKHNDKITNNEETVALSDRELEILELLLKGYSNKDVADQLNISYHTITSHRRNIMKRTDSHNIQELNIFAKLNNLFA